MFTDAIQNRFGSKQGLVNLYLGVIAYRLGCYLGMKKINFKEIHRLVFICSGNICRSPVGEVVASRAGVNAVSYGLDTRGGDSADPRAIAYCETRGVSLKQHRTSRIEEYTPRKGDLLVGMEPKHAKALTALYGAVVPVTLLGLWLQNPVAYLHDPYNTNIVFFDYCESLVESAAQLLAAKVLKH
jgi:protein-tyrosine phosphatase